MKAKSIIHYVVLLVPAMLLTMSVVSCKKDTAGQDDAGPSFSFTGLKAESYNIPVGGSTGVTATASGSNLTYTWSATAGDVFGSGARVTYGAASCCAGANRVKCTVSDGSSSETKEITIVVQ